MTAEVRGTAQLVILGSSLSALGVLRNACRNRMRAVVVDHTPDVAFSSRLGERLLLDRAEEGSWVARLQELGKGHNILIATSDFWLRFLVREREILSTAYRSILHPSNTALRLCLDKASFMTWCATHELDAPRHYPLDADGNIGDPDSVEFPVLLRPAQSVHSAGRSLPKAIEARNGNELARWLECYRKESVVPIVTESLLGRKLDQYSVALARDGTRCLSFVARKLRPLPRNCSVGTYVELCPNPEAEALARRACDLLTYYGVAEAEVLQDRESGRRFLIEINARPWIQYSLSYASGWDFLAFLLDPTYDPQPTRKRNRVWFDCPSDLFVCFSRSIGLVRRRQVGLSSYLRSLMRPKIEASFAWYDPGPWLHQMERLLRVRHRA
jgi:predicted ATP-grasp superfamily ATP-dependent carboligase